MLVNLFPNVTLSKNANKCAETYFPKSHTMLYPGTSLSQFLTYQHEQKVIKAEQPNLINHKKAAMLLGERINKSLENPESQIALFDFKRLSGKQHIRCN